MTSLLIMVAVLQYRWTKELSVATEARIGSTLQPLMLGWHLDFYSELSAVCVAFAGWSDSGARDNWNDYLSPVPGLEQRIGGEFLCESRIDREYYIWETSDSAKLRLLRLNANAAEIEIPSVPEDLRSLLARLQAKSSSLSVVYVLGNSPIIRQSTLSVATTVSHPQVAAIRYHDWMAVR